VGILNTVVLAHATGSMAACKPEFAGGGSVRSQLVGRNRLGMNALVLEQPPQHFQRRMFVAALMDQDVQDLSFVIDGASEIHPPAADPHHHLVEMPPTCRGRPAPAQIGRDQRAKLDHPAAHCFTADLDSTLRQQFFDVADAKRKYRQTA
jgi:hypothetical protein